MYLFLNVKHLINIKKISRGLNEERKQDLRPSSSMVKLLANNLYGVKFKQAFRCNFLQQSRIFSSMDLV